jgi:hypothetical protein
LDWSEGGKHNKAEAEGVVSSSGPKWACHQQGKAKSAIAVIATGSDRQQCMQGTDKK